MKLLKWLCQKAYILGIYSIYIRGSMVQAMISIDENTNRVLNIVKAKYGLKDKSQAICMVVQQYDENMLEPELRPEFVREMKTLMKKGKFTKYSNVSALRKEIEKS